MAKKCARPVKSGTLHESKEKRRAKTPPEGGGGWGTEADPAPSAMPHDSARARVRTDLLPLPLLVEEDQYTMDVSHKVRGGFWQDSILLRRSTTPSRL